jgi:hypothetical protein
MSVQRRSRKASCHAPLCHGKDDLLVCAYLWSDWHRVSDETNPDPWASSVDWTFKPLSLFLSLSVSLSVCVLLPLPAVLLHINASAATLTLVTDV